MNNRFSTAVVVASLGFVAAATPAAATDGTYLQGVGAVNASMGGAGVAATTSLLGSFYLNPATLMAYDGTRMEFAVTYHNPSLTVGSTRGGLTGQTESSDVSTLIPSMGVSYRVSDRVALGLGILGTGGFAADYPVDPANPVIAPQPEGFGAVRTELKTLQITPSVAYAVSEKVWLGGSLTINRASLALQPYLFEAPVTTPGAGNAFDRSYYSSAATGDSRFGVGFLGGLMWNINDMVSVGASYNSKQSFGTFEFNSTYANPTQPNFGQPRTLNLKLELPAILAGGFTMTPLPELLIAADVKYLFYEDAAGFAATDPLVRADGSISGLGWENVLVLDIGGQYRLSDAVLLRAGYNHADNPIPDQLAAINVGTSSIVRNHVSLGIGWRPARRFEISASYTRGFESSSTGAFSGGILDGVSVTNERSENAFTLQFTMGSRGL